jgi:hypothetical protein
MNFTRVAAAAVLAWLASVPVGYVANEIVLKGTFTANAAALRPEADIASNVPIGFAFMLVGFFVFAYTYAKGYEGGSGVIEGIRFGVIVALLIDCFAWSWYWATVPINSAMVMALMIDYVVEFTLYGAIVGAIYKPAAVTKPAAAV